eukprot:s1341_g17.t1
MLSSSSDSEPGDFAAEDVSEVKGEVKEEDDDDQPGHLTSSSCRVAHAEDKPKTLPVEAGAGDEGGKGARDRRFPFESSLKPEWWEAWQRFPKDPETDLATWIRRGAPLGMGAPILQSNGIYPAVQLSSLESQTSTYNYQSVYENQAAAEGELQRLLDKGFAKKLSAEEAKARFQTGTVSRLALISKMKDSGHMKHRLVIDLCRERIVFPRVQDVIRGIQSLWRTHGEEAQEGRPKEIDMDNKMILVSVPHELVDEILQKLGAWSGMIATKEFKSITHKLSVLVAVHIGRIGGVGLTTGTCGSCWLVSVGARWITKRTEVAPAEPLKFYRRQGCQMDICLNDPLDGEPAGDKLESKIQADPKTKGKHARIEIAPFARKQHREGHCRAQPVMMELQRRRASWMEEAA